jgi:TRAP-type uncharacterized transport system substrate-binding protein
MRSVVPAAVITAASIALLGAGSVVGWRPSLWNFADSQTIRVATMSTEGAKKLFGALKQEIAAQHSNLQLSIVETPDAAGSVQALRGQSVDAAVMRSDEPAAADGRTIFVLRNLYLAVLVPANSSIDSISSLKTKKVGVLTKDGALDPMAKVVLEFYGIEETRVIRLALKELTAALKHRQISALVAVGSSAAGPIGDAVEAFQKATKSVPKVLDISEAKAIANRFPVYDEAEISAGTFGGAPAVPAEKVATISANLLLVSRPSLGNSIAGELTRMLLATKAKVATTLPEAGQLAAPSTDNDDLLLAHPGTVAFLNGEQSSILDDPTDVMLLGSMLFGLLGSLAAWLRALGKKTKAQELKREMRRLPILLKQLDTSRPEQLDAMEQELARLSEWLLQKFMAEEISYEDFLKADARLGCLGMLIRKQRASACPAGLDNADKESERADAKAWANKSGDVWTSSAKASRSTGDLYRLSDRQRERDGLSEGAASTAPAPPLSADAAA